ncbi:MAG: 4-hydroxythreonine-4-phosphate dehydrogenase PdxA [Pseudohongiellaceae bacterium]
MAYRLAITPGEPAGIGPDICLQLAQQPPAGIELLIIGDPTVLEQRAKLLGLPIKLVEQRLDQPPAPTLPGQLSIYPVATANSVKSGVLDPANAAYVLETLTTAVNLCKQGICDALVTGPVHKGNINEGGFPFSGHTEFLAALCHSDLTVMMLATKGLRVALVTTHLPLAEVPAAITTQRLERTITILNEDLRHKFGIATPRILVCGLNPHAGEGGHLGREEIDVIEPVLARQREKGIMLLGPLPADTLFTAKYLDHADAVLSMYHDQGLPVLKFKGFGHACNITLGLPIIRTSVDHGTALDLAGSGKAEIGSLRNAISTAIEMASHWRRPNPQ